VIYINGVAQPLVEGDSPLGQFRRQPAAWRIGNNGSTSSTFAGIFDEFRIYGRLLSPVEVAAHINGGIPVRGAAELGLFAGFHCDENSGITALDYSGNGLHASLLNGTRWVPY
jgi:hypothetical protein